MKKAPIYTVSSTLQFDTPWKLVWIHAYVTVYHAEHNWQPTMM